MSQTRIVIADPCEIVRIGLIAALRDKNRFAVIGQAATAEEVFQTLSFAHPDVLIMDVHLPGMDGMDLCRQVVDLYPYCRVVVFTASNDDHLLFDSIRAGASGFVLKQSGINEILDTIDRVGQGRTVLDPALTRVIFKRVRQIEQTRAAATFSGLSLQEVKVLGLIAEGLTNRKIAEQMNLGEGTIRNYVSNLLGKLHLANRVEAAAFAVQHRVREYLLTA